MSRSRDRVGGEGHNPRLPDREQALSPGAPHPGKGSSPPDRWSRNRTHWSENLDARNLGAARASVGTFRRDLALYQTPDVLAALGALEPLDGRLTLDLGGGLALGAVLLARRGARVVICDVSRPRLERARVYLRALGLEDRVHLVVGAAESLPFADGVFARVFTKSVLIHVDLALGAGELARVMQREGGVAAFLEPQRRNPFVNAWRALLAPREWQAITTYFGLRQWRTVVRAFGNAGALASVRLQPWYFLGFFASAFQFAVASRRMARLAEAILLPIDRWLFARSEGIRRRAWFGLMVLRFEKSKCDNSSHPQ